MKSKFMIYVVDTETTGLDENKNEIIEISLYRINDNQQKTWCIKPTNYEVIQPDALRINGHKLDDLKHLTKFGKETYLDSTKVVVEIENWMMEDLGASEDRILVGQNPTFDIGFMKNLWIKNNSIETFPWGKRPHVLDTRQIALFLDLVKGERSEYYNLGSLVEKFGVHKLKAHRAAEDTIMTKNLILAQLDIVRQLLVKD